MISKLQDNDVWECDVLQPSSITNNRPCPNQQLDKIFDTTKEGSKEILHFDIQDLYQRYKVLNPNPKFLLCTSIYIYCAHHRKPSRQASGATIEFYIAMAKIISRAFQLLMNIKVTIPHIVISPNFFLICFSSPLNDYVLIQK